MYRTLFLELKIIFTHIFIDSNVLKVLCKYWLNF